MVIIYLNLTYRRILKSPINFLTLNDIHSLDHSLRRTKPYFKMYVRCIKVYFSLVQWTMDLASHPWKPAMTEAPGLLVEVLKHEHEEMHSLVPEHRLSRLSEMVWKWGNYEPNVILLYHILSKQRIYLFITLLNDKATLCLRFLLNKA